MNLSIIKEKINQNPRVKQIILNLIVNPVRIRPRMWIRIFQFLFIKKGKGSIIYRSVRKDLVPFNRISIGKKTVIESNSTLNNMVGDIIVGDRSRVGIANTIIGPVSIGNNVNIAQNVIISGLNHNYQDISRQIDQQGVTTSPVSIGNDVWIGANSVILPGVTIGQHSIIGAESAVINSVTDYSVAVGNPARIIRKYNFEKKKWEKINSNQDHNG